MHRRPFEGRHLVYFILFVSFFLLISGHHFLKVGLANEELFFLFI